MVNPLNNRCMFRLQISLPKSQIAVIVHTNDAKLKCCQFIFEPIRDESPLTLPLSLQLSRARYKAQSFSAMQFLLFIILLLCANFLNGCPAFPKCCVEYCYSEDTVRHQNYLMNTKTAYQLVKGQHPITPPSGCTPSKLWLLSRHGTRLPTAKSIKKMEKLPQIRTEILANYAHGNYPTEGPLCDADLKLLANWNWDANITEDLGDFLTVQGWNDLKGLAEFYKKQFPGMFGEYSPEKFHFRHSNTQRADASYKAFIDGLYGDNANERIPNPPVPERDTLLRPYDLCPAWAQQKEDLDDPSSEVSKFKASSLYRKVIEDVSTKAGYSSPLTVKTVESMFELCAFEVAWRIGGDSPWCTVSLSGFHCSLLNNYWIILQLFTEDQIRVLEYARDMTEWYESGSATDLNGRLTCELVQDMIGKFSDKTYFICKST